MTNDGKPLQSLFQTVFALLDKRFPALTPDKPPLRTLIDSSSTGTEATHKLSRSDARTTSHKGEVNS